jgi:hypothetical protein
LLGKRTQDLAGKLDDFEFRATYTIVQHLHFFGKKSEKSKTYYKKYKMVELSFKNDIFIGVK